MRLLLNGNAFGQDLTGSPVTVATIAAPSAAPALFRLRIQFSGLDVAHELVVREQQDAFAIATTVPGSGGDDELVEVEALLRPGDTDVVVSVSDALSANASFEWALYEVVSDTVGVLTAEQDARLGMISGQGVYVVSPYPGGDLVLFQGDAWSKVEGTGRQIIKPPGAIWPADLTGYTITSRLTKATKNPNPSISNTLDFTCTLGTLTGLSQSVWLECVAADTAKLAVGAGSQGHEWEVIATKGTSVVTLISGTCTVKRSLYP